MTTAPAAMSTASSYNAGQQQPSLLDPPFWIGAIILIGILLILGLLLCLKRHYEDDISQCRPCRRRSAAAAERQEENFYGGIRLGASKRRSSQIPQQLAATSAAGSAAASECDAPTADGTDASPDCRQQRSRRQEAAQRFFAAVTHGADSLLTVQQHPADDAGGRRVLEAAEIRIEKLPSPPPQTPQSPTTSGAVVIQVEPPPEAGQDTDVDEDLSASASAATPEVDTSRHQQHSAAAVLDEDEEQALNALVEEVANRILGMSHSAENLLSLADDVKQGQGRAGKRENFAHNRSLTLAQAESTTSPTEGSNRSSSSVRGDMHRRRRHSRKSKQDYDDADFATSEHWASVSTAAAGIFNPSLRQDSAESGGACRSCCSLPTCGHRLLSRPVHCASLCDPHCSAGADDDHSLVDRLVRQASSGCGCRDCRRGFRDGLRDLRRRFRLSAAGAEHHRQHHHHHRGHQHRHRRIRCLPSTEDLREEDPTAVDDIEVAVQQHQRGPSGSSVVATWVERHSTGDAKQLHRCNSIEDMSTAKKAAAAGVAEAAQLQPGAEIQLLSARKRPLIKSNSDEIVYEDPELPLEKLHSKLLQEASIVAASSSAAEAAEFRTPSAVADSAASARMRKSSTNEQTAGQTLLHVPPPVDLSAQTFETAPRCHSPTPSMAVAESAPIVAGDTFIYIEDWSCRNLESHSAILPAVSASRVGKVRKLQRQRRHQTVKPARRPPRKSTQPPPQPPTPRCGDDTSSDSLIARSSNCSSGEEFQPPSAKSKNPAASTSSKVQRAAVAATERIKRLGDSAYQTQESSADAIVFSAAAKNRSETRLDEELKLAARKLTCHLDTAVASSLISSLDSPSCSSELTAKRLSSLQQLSHISEEGREPPCQPTSTNDAAANRGSSLLKLLVPNRTGFEDEIEVHV